MLESSKMRLLPVMLLLVFTAQSFAADDEAPFEQEKAKLKQEAEKEAQQLKAIKAERIEDVLQFKILDNDLALQTTLAPTDGYVRLHADGISGFAKVLVTATASGNAFNLIHQDFSPADTMVVFTTVFSVPHNLHVSRDEERTDERRNIQLIQSDQYTTEGDGKIKLYINVSKKMSGEVTADLKLSAANILELRRKYPVEVAKYVEPIFRDLRQEAILGAVDPRLAWQVFGSLFAPSKDLETKVQALVKQLDAESFADREAASASLAKLGAPAGIVLSRISRSGMTEEQQTRIDALVAPYKPLPDEDAAKLRADKFFLLDTLYCDEPQIRQWALKELNNVLKSPVAFDVNASLAQRKAAISRLRDSLLTNVATQPTRAGATRPATMPLQAPKQS
jgi:hypothetical protein